MNIVDFLEARIAEDEKVAREAATLDHGSWTFDPVKGRVMDAKDYEWVIATGMEDPPIDGVDGVHIARWDPARVLKECAAKRTLIATMVANAATCPPDDWPEAGFGIAALADYSRRCLRILAAVYDDHPDYRQEWA